MPTVESNFATTLTQSLGNAAGDLQIYLDVVPENSEGYLIISPAGSDYEIIYYSSKDSNSVTCPASNGRGLSLTALTRTTVAANRLIHGAGRAVVQSADHYLLNDKSSLSDDQTFTGDYTFSGDVVFSGSVRVPVFADATARDAAITSPENGMEAYLTDTGKFTDYTGGSWIERESGGTFPNASTTVAGKVEMATQAEVDAGTATGGTGAQLAVGPAELAITMQNSTHSYAADAEASDAYAIALDPPISAYTAGQLFLFKANTANTGASSLDVNGVGPITIKKNHDQDTVTGDLEAGGQYLVSYDSVGPVFQLHTASNQNHINVAGPASNADTLHTHTNLGGGFSLTSGEALDGSSTPVSLAQTGTIKSEITVHMNGNSVTGSLVTGLTDGWWFQASSFLDLDFGAVDTKTRRAQSFTYVDTDAETVTVESLLVWLLKQGAPTDNITIEIYDDDTDKPGSLVTNGVSDTYTGSSLTGGQNESVEFVWSTPPEITAGDKYWFVIRRSGVNDPVNYYEIGYENADNYSGHGRSVFTASGPSWTSEASSDIMFHMRLEADYGGKVYKLDSNDFAKMNYIGFTTDNVAADETIAVVPFTGILDDFTGLTTSSTYLASATPGSFGLTGSGVAGSSVIPIGKSVSGDTMILNNGMKMAQRTIITPAFIPSVAAVATVVDLFIPTGFKPTYVRFKYSVSSHNAANTAETTEQEYVWTSVSGGPTTAPLLDGFDDGAGTSWETAIRAQNTSWGLYVNNVYENGIELRIKLADVNHSIALAEMVAMGY